MKTQVREILEHLATGQSITPLEALQKYGCFRLGARIHELKSSGLEIQSVRVRTLSGAWVAQYSMRVRPGAVSGRIVRERAA